MCVCNVYMCTYRYIRRGYHIVDIHPSTAWFLVYFHSVDPYSKCFLQYSWAKWNFVNWSVDKNRKKSVVYARVSLSWHNMIVVSDSHHHTTDVLHFLSSLKNIFGRGENITSLGHRWELVTGRESSCRKSVSSSPVWLLEGWKK